MPANPVASVACHKRPSRIDHRGCARPGFFTAEKRFSVVSEHLPRTRLVKPAVQHLLYNQAAPNLTKPVHDRVRITYWETAEQLTLELTSWISASRENRCRNRLCWLTSGGIPLGFGRDATVINGSRVLDSLNPGTCLRRTQSPCRQRPRRQCHARERQETAPSHVVYLASIERDEATTTAASQSGRVVGAECPVRVNL